VNIATYWRKAKSPLGDLGVDKKVSTTLFHFHHLNQNCRHKKTFRITPEGFFLCRGL